MRRKSRQRLDLAEMSPLWQGMRLAWAVSLTASGSTNHFVSGYLPLCSVSPLAVNRRMMKSTTNHITALDTIVMAGPKIISEGCAFAKEDVVSFNTQSKPTPTKYSDSATTNRIRQTRFGVITIGLLATAVGSKSFPRLSRLSSCHQGFQLQSLHPRTYL